MKKKPKLSAILPAIFKKANLFMPEIDLNFAEFKCTTTDTGADKTNRVIAFVASPARLNV